MPIALLKMLYTPFNHAQIRRAFTITNNKNKIVMVIRIDLKFFLIQLYIAKYYPRSQLKISDPSRSRSSI